MTTLPQERGSEGGERMGKLIRITDWESDRPTALDVFEGIVIQLHVPCSHKMATVLVSPDVMLEMTRPGGRTRKMRFNLGKLKKQRIRMAGSEYEIELMGVEKEVLEGGEWNPVYEFYVAKKSGKGRQVRKG
ncbi:MAG: hypothetical protein V1809_10370 [Planctomycetota bacterium]